MIELFVFWSTFKHRCVCFAKADDIDEIPLLEIANTQAWVVREAQGMVIEAEDLARSAASLLGVSTFTKKVRQRSMRATTILV